MPISIPRLVIVLGIVILGIGLAYFLIPLIYPFLIAWLIAAMINPLVNRLEKRFKLPRWAAVSLSLLLFVLVVVGILSVLIAQVTIELLELSDKIPGYITKGVQYFESVLPQAQEQWEKVKRQYVEWNQKYGDQLTIDHKLEDWLTSVGNTAIQILNRLFAWMIGMLAAIPNLVTVFVISVLAAFFISKDYDYLRARILRWIPDQVQGSLGAVLKDLRKALLGFVRAQFILISITALIVTLGLLLLNVKYAITIGLLTGLVDLLPYLGTGAVFIPWILYLFLMKQYKLVIGLSILYGVIVLVRQIMEPKVLAESVGLDPLQTLIALFVGLQLFGFLGLIIGPVALVILQAMIRAHVFSDLWRYIRS